MIFFLAHILVYKSSQLHFSSKAYCFIGALIPCLSLFRLVYKADSDTQF